MNKNTTSKKKTISKNSIDPKELLGCFLFVLGFVVVIGSLVGYQYRNQIYRILKNQELVPSSRNPTKRMSLHDIRNRKILENHLDKIFGIDISHYQSNINWRDVQWIYDDFPIHFVIVRSTMGISDKDLTYRNNWSDLHNGRFIRGAYHYYRPDEPSTEQAQNFINTVTLKNGDLPPILDIEKLPRNQSLNQLKVGLRNWIDMVERHYGVKPIIYSGQHYYENYLFPEFNDCVIWIANYNAWITDPKPNWAMWQFSEKGQVEGIQGHVDLNVFNGDLEDLNQLRIGN